MKPRKIVGRLVNGLLVRLHLRIIVLQDSRPIKEFPRAPQKTYLPDERKAGQIEELSLWLHGRLNHQFAVSQPITVQVDFVLKQDASTKVAIMIEDNHQNPHISTTDTGMYPSLPIIWKAGKHRVQMEFPPELLNIGRYYVRASLSDIDHHVSDGLSFEIVDNTGRQPDHGLLAIFPEYRVLDR